MNHCLIQSVVKSNPQMRYTKENQTPIAEMIVSFKGLRSDDPDSDLKVLGWGSIAQEMMDQLKEGNKIVLEGRLKMNSVTRQDGTKEKQAELTASKIHHITSMEHNSNCSLETKTTSNEEKDNHKREDVKPDISKSNWDSSPLVPEVDEIPF
tara:strand:+ start:188 stop:643 length:456 start_codon:yes stop_codon:yes gene_type:complete